MDEYEDFIVEQPYEPTENERNAISELSVNGLQPSNWNSNNKYIKSFKDNLRDHMYYQQNQLCAYCRIHLSKACDFLQREHIVPKSKHPNWMFEPNNLCIACDYCNNNKGNKEVLTNSDVTEYPTDSKNFKIINPFLDKYSDHINLLNGILYVGKTSKGIFTIEACKLSRISLAIERAEKKMETENPDSVLACVLRLLSTTNMDAAYVDNFTQQIQRSVMRYKKLHLFSKGGSSNNR